MKLKYCFCKIINSMGNSDLIFKELSEQDNFYILNNNNTHCI